jgi:N-methylhydantoinase A
MIIGLDVGGTHTDVVLVGEGGLERQFKVPTDTAALFETVLTGLEKITENIPIDNISHAVLSTTLTTNAIIQNKLPPAGMIVSGGPGVNPEAFRTNNYYYIASGSIDHSGREIQPVDPDQVIEIAGKLKEQGIRNVGVVGKFSTRNTAHETRIAEIIAPHFDKVFMGHLISGHLSFPRRIHTTFLNASVYPLHKTFFEAVKTSLAHKGITIPIYILKADGGTMAFAASIDFPGQTVLSGPSASVMGSLAFAPGKAETIVMDIGGTTTDMAVLIDQVPLLSPLGIELGKYKTLIRALHSYSIGLGGDSVVRMEENKIVIGPDRNGPAMAYGGPSLTPTDALFVLGRIKTGGDREKSAKGMQSIADVLGLSLEKAAEAVFDQTCRQIMAAARHMIEEINRKPVYTIKELLKGHQVKPTHILVLGGPAGHFVDRLAELSGLPAATVPAWSVANAIGTALSRATCEVSLFADTQKGFIMAPEESFSQPVKVNFTRQEALQIGYQLLRQKAHKIGADMDSLEMDILEELEFNMVRGFRLTGKNIRIKLQVKPGLIRNYKTITDKIAAGALRGSI